MQGSAKIPAKQRLVALDSRGSPSGGQHDYTSLSGTETDTVLELSDLRIGLNAVYSRNNNSLTNPPSHLEISVHTRLVRTANGNVIDERDIGFRSPDAHIFVFWTADDASLFRKELDTALTTLADTIGDCLLWVAEG